jgi:GH24 family phage-related lysozyme (muramidase)
MSTFNFSTPMTQADYSQKLLTFMIALEAMRSLPYVDTNGFTTIGWGYVLRFIGLSHG